jgi:hypothetical protein
MPAKPANTGKTADADPPRSCPLDSILTHLEAIGEIRRIAGEPQSWAA